MFNLKDWIDDHIFMGKVMHFYFLFCCGASVLLGSLAAVEIHWLKYLAVLVAQLIEKFFS